MTTQAEPRTMTRDELWAAFRGYEGDLKISVGFMREDSGMYICSYQGPCPRGVKSGGGTGPSPELAIADALGVTLAPALGIAEVVAALERLSNNAANPVMAMGAKLRDFDRGQANAYSNALALLRRVVPGEDTALLDALEAMGRRAMLDPTTADLGGKHYYLHAGKLGSAQEGECCLQVDSGPWYFGSDLRAAIREMNGKESPR
jgi:hypothetical protein